MHTSAFIGNHQHTEACRCFFLTFPDLFIIHISIPCKLQFFDTVQYYIKFIKPVQ